MDSLFYPKTSLLYRITTNPGTLTQIRVRTKKKVTMAKLSHDRGVFTVEKGERKVGDEVVFGHRRKTTPNKNRINNNKPTIRMPSNSCLALFVFAALLSNLTYGQEV